MVPQSGGATATSISGVTANSHLNHQQDKTRAWTAQKLECVERPSRAMAQCGTVHQLLLLNPPSSFTCRL
ncbi:hypothetical protein VTK26DRAFT_428 [Humicola hyalothermophila]